MKVFLATLALLFFLGCNRDNVQIAAVEPVDVIEVSQEAVPPVLSLYEEMVYLTFNRITSEVSAPAISFALSADYARPGEPLSIGLRTNPLGRRFQALLFDSRERRIARAVFFNLGEQEGAGQFLAAVMAIPSTALIGNSLIRIEADGEVLAELPFTIIQRDFYSETIELSAANTALRTTPDPRRNAESDQLWAILNRTGTEIYSDGLFVSPVTSTRRTSVYGSRRLFQYSDGSISDPAIHAGVDFGVPTGTEVRASGTGRVVLARERLITGYSVILEHMPGVYSLYYHMDSIAVIEGEIVQAGDLLGRSGATGLATGPHLHWEIRVSGENADPDAFLSRAILDKDHLINRMSSEQ